MQTRKPTETTEPEPAIDDRPALQLDVEVLEDRIAPSLFAFNTSLLIQYHNPQDPWLLR